MSLLLPATIQVDVDNIWTHLSDLGISDHQDAAIIYQESITRFLELFARLNIKATFFCVGRDARFPPVQDMLQTIVRQGHEIANHSLSHLPHFPSLTLPELRPEIVAAHRLLENAAGVPLVGFKAPGWGVNIHTLPILEELHYHYDSSFMPTCLAPLLTLARWALSGGVRTRKKIGSFRHGFAPLHPHFPQVHYPFLKTRRLSASVIEIPQTVFPLLRLPFHSTFVFLGGLTYFKAGLALVKQMQLPLNYVFHAIDLLPENVEPRLARFPAMRKPLAERRLLLQKILEDIKKNFEIKTTIEFSKLYNWKK